MELCCVCAGAVHVRVLALRFATLRCAALCCAARHAFISFHFISFHFISFHFISFHFISFHFISFHFISFHFISFHFISFHFISFHFISFHFISFHFISFHFISFHMPPWSVNQRGCTRGSVLHVSAVSAYLQCVQSTLSVSCAAVPVDDDLFRAWRTLRVRRGVDTPRPNPKGRRAPTARCLHMHHLHHHLT